MSNTNTTIVVAGHICLDMIPTFELREASLQDLLVPGKLIDVGPLVTATGGTVSNTGLALHRLGIPTRLMGKVGDDLVGRAILDVLRSYDPELAKGMIVNTGSSSSYTVVISPPGVDRMFLHCPGANDTFGPEDIAYDQLPGARIFHFGYPPLMRRMYENEGAELATLLSKVKQQGLTTSLDMAKPDPASDAGRVAWPALLERVLPHVDIFVPSLDEILFMLGYDDSANQQDDGALLSEVSQRLLDLGASVVGLKLGIEGLYLRTTGNMDKLVGLGAGAPADPSVWTQRELLAPCFKVNVVGTAGSGDCTVAGFLAGMVNDLAPEQVLTAAVGVGACNVEAIDTVSGIPSWETVQKRIAAGWARCSTTLNLAGWELDNKLNMWIGPNDHNK